MRSGQNKRMRGRNSGRKGPNPLTRTYESNGPDVKIRGTAHHVAEKYLQLARDAQSSGDPVMAENYLQHAEHYFRIIAAAQQAQQQGPVAYPRQVSEADFDEPDDDEEGGVPDRFAPSPSGFGQPGYGVGNGPQPPYGAPQPQPQAYGERQAFNSERQGQDRPYPERNPRPDRPYQDRNNPNRNGQNRGPRDHRPPREFRSDQPRGDQPRGEAARGDVRPETRPPIEDSEAASRLPAFITAPTRLAVADPASESPLANGAEPRQSEMAETGGFHLRPRRRRRNRPAIIESGAATGETSGETEFPGELPLDD